jgi:YggT family protein
MAAVIHFVFIIINALINVLVFAMIANAILSWLVAFDVINLRNRAVGQVARFLDAICRPLLRPFQRFIPPLGGVDITPIIVLIVLTAIQRALLFPLESWLVSLVGGYS